MNTFRDNLESNLGLDHDSSWDHSYDQQASSHEVKRAIAYDVMLSCAWNSVLHACDGLLTIRLRWSSLAAVGVGGLL